MILMNLVCVWGSLRLDTNRLNTSHSQRLNSGKPLGTGRCGWWCPIDPCPNESLPCVCVFARARARACARVYTEWFRTTPCPWKDVCL